MSTLVKRRRLKNSGFLLFGANGTKILDFLFLSPAKKALSLSSSPCPPFRSASSLAFHDCMPYLDGSGSEDYDGWLNLAVTKGKG